MTGFFYSAAKVRITTQLAELLFLGGRPRGRRGRAVFSFSALSCSDSAVSTGSSTANSACTGATTSTAVYSLRCCSFSDSLCKVVLRVQLRLSSFSCSHCFRVYFCRIFDFCAYCRNASSVEFAYTDPSVVATTSVVGSAAGVLSASALFYCLCLLGLFQGLL